MKSQIRSSNVSLLVFQGHIGSTNWGIVLLSPSTRVFNLTENSVCENDSVLEDDSVDVIREIVILAQECEVLTVRGYDSFVLLCLF